MSEAQPASRTATLTRMSRITVSRTVAAPVATVFAVVTNIERLPESNPDVVRVEFLTDQRSGAGTRFRETRSSRGREMVTELEVTEYVENEHARFVTDTGGTVWDTVFTFRPTGSPPGSATDLEIQLDARAHKLLAKIMNPLIKGMVRKGMEKHVAALSAYCEGL
jgi:uncharacterized protein YndB with AHSA1/START domain